MDKKKKTKSLEITIALPVYNEEANIKHVLKSIFKQKTRNFSLLNIIVLSDGSTDNTVKEAKKINDKRIVVIADKHQKGKALRLNELFHLSKGTYLVLLDADVILDGVDTLEKLLQPFHDDARIGLVSGKAIPTKSSTFIEKSANTSVSAYCEIIDKINQGNNVYAVEGRILAIKKSLGLKIPLPKNGIATDAFLYFSTVKQKQTFKYVKEATVTYSSPKNMKEQIIQNKRFVSRKYLLEKYFGSMVEKELLIPRTIYIPVMLKYLYKDPLHSLAIFFVNAYSKYLARKDRASLASLWPIATSTKKRISHK